MNSLGTSTSQGLGLSTDQLFSPLNASVSENISPNAGAADNGEKQSDKSAARKNWEKETAAERLARRTKYLELANDKDPKTVSLQQQAKAMAEPVIEIEDFLL